MEEFKDKISNPILVVTGPTGCGKTALSIALAGRTASEIISADSVQVYKYFDIGSAKPTREQLEKVKHHLISELEPHEDFNAGIFCKMAGEKIKTITEQGKVPIISGGTGLYIQSLVSGLVEIGDISQSAKEQLQKKELEILGSIDDAEGLSQEERKSKLKQGLHDFLYELDKESALSIMANDISRMRRAILVKLSNARSILSYQQSHLHKIRNYNAFIIVLFPQRDLLYNLIDDRVDEMMRLGLLEEVRVLKNKYIGQIHHVRPFASIGYKQMLQVEKGEYQLADAVMKIKQATRNYAKRQFTWWKNQPRKLKWETFSDKECLNYQYGSLDFEKVADDICNLYNTYLSSLGTETKVCFLPVAINQ